MAPVNALAFGGGGLVGTAKSLGHLIGLDQVVRDPASRLELTKSFFDYMVEAEVTIDQLELRFDEVVDRMPREVQNGQLDHIHRYFRLCGGISGGSFLASAVASELPLLTLVREAVHFPFTYYFRPDLREYLRAARGLPKIPLNVLKMAYRERGGWSLRRGRSEGLLMPIMRRVSRVGFELLAAFQDILPRGIFTGQGIEDYVEKLAREQGLKNSFQAVRSRGRHLLIIAERFNTANRLSDPHSASTAVYFGAAPHDTIPVSRAIRASCSIPGITTPIEYADPERGGTRYLLVDGAIGKTIGRRRLFTDHDIGVVITINPIVPYIGQLDNIVDSMEQLYRKLIYSRLKAVENHIEKEVGERTIHIESNPDHFFFNMLRLDKITEGLFEGYYQTLNFCAEQYGFFEQRLGMGGLCLIPRKEICALLESGGASREHQRMLKRNVMEKEKVSVQVGNALQQLVRPSEDAA